MAEIDGIKVISSDGKEFTLRFDLISHFDTIIKLNQERFDRPGSSGPLALDVASSILRTARRENLPSIDEENPELISFDKETLFINNDYKRLAQILSATSVLKCEVLRRITSKLFANFLKGKSVEQLMEIFGVQNIAALDDALEWRREKLREKDREKEARRGKEKEARKAKERERRRRK
uniref:Skp1 domain-containing protein n=1 Tax=Syphacia muris TaxID=451379 RepID=A0A0N5B105_9BILA